MRSIFVEVLLNILCAAVIGLLVGIALLFVCTVENPVRHLLSSSLIGIMIGIACKLSGVLIYRYGSQNISWSYLMTFVITLLGSFIAFYGEELRSMLITLVIAEPLALLITFMNIRYICRLNNGLRRKQALFKEKHI